MSLWRYGIRAVVSPTALLLACNHNAFAQSSVSSATPPVDATTNVTRFTLRWKGTADCSDGGRVTARVQQLVSSPIESMLNEPLVVYAVVEQDLNAMRLQLTLLDRTGVHERILEGASCDELVEAAALVLGLAINPVLSGEISSKPALVTPNEEPKEPPSRITQPILNVSAPAPPLVAPPNTRVVPNTEPPRELTAPVLPRPRLLVGTTAEARLGLFPGLTWGMGLSGSYEGLPLAVSASLAWVNATANLSSTSTHDVAFAAWLLSPRLCWYDATSDFTVGPCASTSLGIVWARALGVTEPTPTWHGFESSGLGLSARLIHRGSAYAAMDVDATVPWRRTRYVVAGQEVHRPSSVGGRLALQLGLAF